MTNGPPTTAAAATKIADELGELVRPVGTLLRNRSAEFVVGIALLVTALALFSVAGAAVDDRAITANKAVAEAQVLDGSTFTRTLVRFTAANGEAVVPENGISYPRGLQVGQQVAVEYDVSDPNNVRVAGRTALDQAGPLAIVAILTWALLGPVAIGLRNRRRRARVDAGS